MTERKIHYALKQIEACTESGYYTEALIRTYHLNLAMLRYFLDRFSEHTPPAKALKFKATIARIMNESDHNAELRSVLSRRNLKMVKPWTEKMEVFLKTLRQRQPANTKLLLAEAQKIAGLLTISLRKALATA